MGIFATNSLTIWWLLSRVIEHRFFRCYYQVMLILEHASLEKQAKISGLTWILLIMLMKQVKDAHQKRELKEKDLEAMTWISPLTYPWIGRINFTIDA